MEHGAWTVVVVSADDGLEPDVDHRLRGVDGMMSDDGLGHSTSIARGSVVACIVVHVSWWWLVHGPRCTHEG